MCIIISIIIIVLSIIYYLVLYIISYDCYRWVPCVAVIIIIQLLLLWAPDGPLLLLCAPVIIFVFQMGAMHY